MGTLSELWENGVLQSELWENGVLPSELWENLVFAVGIVGTYSSELWEPIFYVGIVGKSRFSSFLTLLSEFWEPPTK